MTVTGSRRADAPLLVLAHGAGAGEKHPWMKRVAAGLVSRGVAVVTFDFPYMAAGKKVPDPAPVLEQTYAEVWAELIGSTAEGGRRWFVGGKSMGGRIATQAVAKDLLSPRPAGIVCFGYPLHPPGKPSQRRDAHLRSIHCPLLFLHGTRDPFGTTDEMTSLAQSLRGATLHVVDGGDHSLIGARKDHAGLETALDVAARWMGESKNP